MMKFAILALVGLGAGSLASAQLYSTWYPHGYHRTWYPYPNVIYPTRIIYLGRWAPSHRTSSYPFAYGSFFYGQSWPEWRRSQGG